MISLALVLLLAAGSWQVRASPSVDRAGHAPESTTGARPSGAPAAPEGVLDLEDRPVDPLKSTKAKLTVLLFVRSDCPISNRYAPEVRRLHDVYAPKGVAWWIVYPDPDETVAAIRKHLVEYAYGPPGLRDTRHALVKSTGASVTPEAVVFKGSTMVYRGRIDDRWADLGKMRPEPAAHDLENAIREALAGKTISRRTRAIGCDIPELE